MEGGNGISQDGEHSGQDDGNGAILFNWWDLITPSQ